jgi:hypothetical protein
MTLTTIDRARRPARTPRRDDVPLRVKHPQAGFRSLEEGFAISKSDGDFLLEYIPWRMDHPIVK